MSSYDLRDRYNELKQLARLNVAGWDEALVDRAYGIAQAAHSGQKRISEKPFISHPLEVAYILAESKCDNATVIAALLHDVVEDSDVTLTDLERSFDQQIVFLVDSLTFTFG